MKKQTSKSNNIKRILTSAIIILILAAVGVGIYFKMNRDQMMTMKTKTIPEIVTKIIGDPSVTVKEISNLKVTSGVYEFELTLDYQGTPRKYTSYISKDGKLFFSAGTKVAELSKAAATTPEAQKKYYTCDEVEKSDKPLMTAYVVSQCPYGLQMQRVIAKAIKEQPALAQSLNVRYIGSIEDNKIVSMHGDAEAQENLRQICIREEQNTLYWPYVSCYMKEGKSDECVVSSGVSKSKVDACMSDPTKGIAYAKKDFDGANALSIQSSPSLVINDKFLISESSYGGRTPDAMREAVCCASKDKPGFCSTPLTKDAVAASFAATDAAVAGTAGSAANCGN